jgi:hypothetical protein
MQHLKLCPERSLLLDQWNIAVASYAQMARELSTTAGKATAERYLDLLSEVTEARQRAEEARQQLLIHMREHGCKTQVDGWNFDLR